MIYKVEVNMDKARPYLVRSGVQPHREPVITIWITGEDPDEVCAKAKEKLCADILREHNTRKVKDAMPEISANIRVIRIRTGKTSK